VKEVVLFEWGRRGRKKNLVIGGNCGGSAVPPQARAVPLLLVNDFKFFSFFRIIFGQIPIKQIKITQNKQNKSN